MFNYAAPPLLPLSATVDDRGIRLTAGGVTLRFDGVLVTASADGPVAVQTGWVQSGDRPADWITFEATVNTERPARLNSVTWFAGSWEPGVERAVQSTDLQDGFLFLRKDGISFFLSLDFPYSRRRTAACRAGMTIRLSIFRLPIPRASPPSRPPSTAGRSRSATTATRDAVTGSLVISN